MAAHICALKASAAHDLRKHAPKSWVTHWNGRDPSEGKKGQVLFLCLYVRKTVQILDEMCN